MGHLGSLRISDRTFQVTKATLQGNWTRNKSLEWYLDVETESVKYDDEWLSPYAYIQRYPSQARSMSEFLSTTINIENGEEFCDHQLNPWSRACSLYVFWHDFVDNTHIQFQKAEGTLAKVVWTAICADPWGELDDENLDLRIETLVDFLGITILVSEEAAARAELEDRFSLKGFGFQSEPDQSGGLFMPLPNQW